MLAFSVKQAMALSTFPLIAHPFLSGEIWMESREPHTLGIYRFRMGNQGGGVNLSTWALNGQGMLMLLAMNTVTLITISSVNTIPISMSPVTTSCIHLGRIFCGCICNIIAAPSLDRMFAMRGGVL